MTQAIILRLRGALGGVSDVQPPRIVRDFVGEVEGS